MDVRELKALLNLMHENGLVELEIEDKKGKVRLVRGTVALHDHPPKQAAVAVAPSKGQQKITSKVAAPMADKAPAGSIELQANQKLVESPMVGTFYRAPSPDSAPYIKEGQEVAEETVVCIIEAMKVMNEIKAEVKGLITEVLVENGAAVQYGQPLFRVK